MLSNEELQHLLQNPRCASALDVGQMCEELIARRSSTPAPLRERIAVALEVWKDNLFCFASEEAEIETQAMADHILTLMNQELTDDTLHFAIVRMPGRVPHIKSPIDPSYAGNMKLLRELADNYPDAELTRVDVTVPGMPRARWRCMVNVEDSREAIQIEDGLDTVDWTKVYKQDELDDCYPGGIVE